MSEARQDCASAETPAAQFERRMIGEGRAPPHAVTERTMTRGLSERQQSRLVMYLDEALLGIARAFQKRYVALLTQA